ncbi:MAG: VanZ family protein [Thiolinea sp.]
MTKLLDTIEHYWLALSLLLLIAITLLSLWPADQLPSVPGTDKTHHFIAYGSLMLPVALRQPKNWLFIGLFFVAWSGAIELIQPMVNRYGEWLDLLANATGVLCGIALAGMINMLMRPNRKAWTLR